MAVTNFMRTERYKILYMLLYRANIFALYTFVVADVLFFYLAGMDLPLMEIGVFIVAFTSVIFLVISLLLAGRVYRFATVLYIPVAILLAMVLLSVVVLWMQ